MDTTHRTGAYVAANERKRGGWLAGWLILLAVLYAYEAVSALTVSMPTLSSTERAAVPFLVLAVILTVGAVITLWFWRKAGFYLLLITAVPLVILNVMFGVQLLMALFPLYSLSTTWMLLQPRWQYFH